jgi:hypothetical protein
MLGVYLNSINPLAGAIHGGSSEILELIIAISRRIAREICSERPLTISLKDTGRPGGRNARSAGDDGHVAHLEVHRSDDQLAVGEPSPLGPRSSQLPMLTERTYS